VNDDERLASARRHRHFHRDRTTRGGRPAPVLVIEIPLEGSGRAQIRAESYEDERRLRLWLRHTSRLPTLAVALERCLNFLDEREAA
jgi:hypothetical protein